MNSHSLNLVNFKNPNDIFARSSSTTNRILKSSIPLWGPCSEHEPSLRTLLHSGHLSMIPESSLTETTVPLVETPLREPPEVNSGNPTPTLHLPNVLQD